MHFFKNSLERLCRAAACESEPCSLQASCAVRERVLDVGIIREYRVILGSSSQRLLGDQRSAQPNLLSCANWVLW